MPTQLQIQSSKRIVDYCVLALITVIALLLRLPTLKMGLWLDEFISIYIASSSSLSELYKWLWRGMEFNPPLNHLLLRAYIACFGTNDIIVRLPSLIEGIVLIPVVYWLGTIAHSRKAGLFAALFAALSPQANYFSCQTRPYSISILLNCVCMALFCNLLNSKKQNKSKELAIFIVVLICFCYSSTFGVFSLASLAVASVVLVLRQRFPDRQVESPPFSLSIQNIGVALLIPAIVFLPWLPTMWHQTKIPKPVEPASLLELPWSFAVCLISMLPLPTLVSLWVFWLFLAILMAFLLLQIFKGTFVSKLLPSLRSAFYSMPSSYMVLLTMTLFPAAVMGIVAGVWLGYFRYILPFSPALWVLMAIFVCSLYPPAEDVSSSAVSAAKKSTFKDYAFAFCMVLFVLFNVAFVLWFDQKSQSGLRLVAQAIREGKFDNSVILLAPDLPGPTLYYYSTPAERKAHNVQIYGFVRPEPNSPTIGDVMPDQWVSSTVVDECFERVEKFHEQGFAHLAFMKDSQIYGTAKIPLKLRVQQLFDKLNARYKLDRKEEYPGVTESMQVSFFKL